MWHGTACTNLPFLNSQATVNSDCKFFFFIYTTPKNDEVQMLLLIKRFSEYRIDDDVTAVSMLIRWESCLHWGVLSAVKNKKENSTWYQKWVESGEVELSWAMQWKLRITVWGWLLGSTMIQRTCSSCSCTQFFLWKEGLLSTFLVHSAVDMVDIKKKVSQRISKICATLDKFYFQFTSK